MARAREPGRAAGRESRGRHSLGEVTLAVHGFIPGMPRSLRFLAPLALLLSTLPAAASPSPASLSSLSSLGASSPQGSASSGAPESPGGHGVSGGTSALAAALGLAGVVLVARKRAPAYAHAPRRVTTARGATRSPGRASRYI